MKKNLHKKLQEEQKRNFKLKFQEEKLKAEQDKQRKEEKLMKLQEQTNKIKEDLVKKQELEKILLEEKDKLQALEKERLKDHKKKKKGKKKGGMKGGTIEQLNDLRSWINEQLQRTDYDEANQYNSFINIPGRVQFEDGHHQDIENIYKQEDLNKKGKSKKYFAKQRKIKCLIQ